MSKTFPLCRKDKQGSVLSSTLFSIFSQLFSPTLSREGRSHAPHLHGSGGGLFNLYRLRAKTKTRF